jgi:ketosteroid isomerase-like protein
MMDAERGKTLVREFLDVLHSGDIDGALARTTKDPVLMIFNNAVPDGFRMLAGMVPALFNGTPPTREYTAQFVDGDTVISQITVRGTTQKGEEYQNYYLILCTFEGDKIAKMQEYMDSAYANAKFGLGG